MEATPDRQPDRLAASTLIALALHGALLLAFARLGGFAPASAPLLVAVTLESPQALPPRAAPAEIAAAPREQAAATAPRPGAAAQPGAVAQPAEPRRTTTEALRRALSSLPEDRAPAASTDSGGPVVPALPRATTPSPSNLPPFTSNADAGPPARDAPAAPSGATAPVGSELNLRELDNALSGRGNQGRAPTGGAGAQSAVGQGRAQAAAGPGDAGPQIAWEDASAPRRQLSSAEPVIPDWVKRDPVTLRLVVGFDVAPSGLVSSANIERSSGFADVDAAVLEAVRRWRFDSAGSNRTVRGSVPYVITPR